MASGSKGRTKSTVIEQILNQSKADTLDKFQKVQN
jgi:hypothetical protein